MHVFEQHISEIFMQKLLTTQIFCHFPEACPKWILLWKFGLDIQLKASL